MPRSIVRFTLAALAVTLAACSNSTFSGLRLDITPDRSQYTAGSEVLVTVRNLGDEPVAYSFCAHAVQRETAAGWLTAHFESHPCTAVLRVVNPGESVTGRVALPAGLPGGTYRVYLPGLGDPTDNEASAGLQSRKSSDPFKVTVG